MRRRPWIPEQVAAVCWDHPLAFLRGRHRRSHRPPGRDARLAHRRRLAVLLAAVMESARVPRAFLALQKDTHAPVCKRRRIRRAFDRIRVRSPELIARASDAAAPALLLVSTRSTTRSRATAGSLTASQVRRCNSTALPRMCSFPRRRGAAPHRLLHVEGWVGTWCVSLQRRTAAATERCGSRRFFLGIGDRGQVRFDVAAGGQRLVVVERLARWRCGSGRTWPASSRRARASRST